MFVDLTIHSCSDDGSDDVSADPEVYNFRKTRKDRKNALATKTSDERNTARHWSTWPSVATTLVTCLVLLCY